MSRTDWIEQVSQANWPAARVRNVVKAIKDHRVSSSSVTPPDALPKQRMAREDGIKWLAQTAKIPLIDLKLTRPVQFLAQYFLGGGSCEHNAERDAVIKAIEIVHGTSVRGMNMPADADCASDWMLGLAHKQYLVEHACTCFALDRQCYCDHAGEALVARADLAAVAPLPAPPAPVTPPLQSAEREQTADAPGAPAPASRTAPRHTPEEREVIDAAPRRSPYDDTDDHLFEEPLSTLAEVAERLESLRLRVDAHVAERIAEERAEIAEQQRKDDRAALNRLSDRLVSTEMELGLIDDALDHMYAGQQSPANVVGRLAAIIKRITKMDI